MIKSWIYEGFSNQTPSLNQSPLNCIHLAKCIQLNSANKSQKQQNSKEKHDQTHHLTSARHRKSHSQRLSKRRRVAANRKHGGRRRRNAEQSSSDGLSPITVKLNQIPIIQLHLALRCYSLIRRKTWE